MRATQSIFRVRRQYNKWVGNQTLEDYALRFTAHHARRFSIAQVGSTALGAAAFMALEAIAATVTLQYGFVNAAWAMATVSLVIFITGFPIVYYAARHGLDIDLLTRGAGFGYLGSTVTSLIYATFTFIFFAIEAAILASALNALTGLPLALGYVVSAVAVIPIVTHGISAISKFQVGSQSLWLTLQILALGLVVVFELQRVPDWTLYTPPGQPRGTGFDLALFGAASAMLFALIAQIGEQVDYLRFMPERTEENRRSWWFWLTLAGPGWVLVGLVKMLLGSFLAYLAVSRGMGTEQASDPTLMYQMAFNYLIDSPSVALMLAGVMVILSQMKINVTNAYAGSIAWSNFFSRLTHSHPGRVVWLVFNVLIALLLMELGIYRVLESILGIFAIVALSWLASLSADLMINKPLGLSVAHGEFKRARLYDVNPVGVGAMLVASTVGILAYLGLFGATAASLAHFISLGLCFLLVPLIAWLTRSRYYLARGATSLVPAVQEVEPAGGVVHHTCCICETAFETPDMSHCPAYQGPICSLCCTLDARCKDHCKPEGRLERQAERFAALFLPRRWVAAIDSRIARFLAMFSTTTLLTGGLLAVIYYHMTPEDLAQQALLAQTIWTVFFILMIICGVVAWLFLLARESREVAQSESNRQTQRLYQEIEAHKITDRSLQEAKELAERANNAKSRYLTGISHELRTPLQAILGYAQILSDQPEGPDSFDKGLRIIRRNGEYLTDLIEGLLDISTIEAGRLDIYRNRIKLPELLEQLASMFGHQARAKGIAFNYHRPERLPRCVYSDEKRLRQILINLLSNAVKYTEKGQVDFTVRYRNEVAEFVVSDTGVGIEAGDLERILDPFERVRSSQVPQVSGTGLGLTIVRLLTEVMGGELSIDSTPGSGSQFRVVLHLSRDDTADQSVDPGRAITGYAGARRCVMIVDDEPVHRGLLADLLSPLGFSTREAPDGDTCLARLADFHPDLWLLDMSMPGMSGLELARELRRRGHKAPIIMISADARGPETTVDEDQPFDAYFAKPISNRLLLESIGQLLQLEWLHSELPSTSTTPEVLARPAPGNVTFGAVCDHPLLRELRSYAESGFARGVTRSLEAVASSALLRDDQLQHLRDLAAGFRYQDLADLLRMEPVNE
ncbi:response regulator [Parahaliea maris]|uniref:histidine kinase n=1 Tax=Parahaliea maris TaxID=2716870 RepID=A0A5C9A920_9GAMM|nr:ATP-binding protein [Parahaliea maris]TXS95731.1 response regulator [Parahaliea maris]